MSMRPAGTDTPQVPGPREQRTGGEGRPDILERALVRWNALLAAHRVALTGILVLTGIFFSHASRGIVWQPDVLAFFSADSDDVRSMREAAGKPGLATQLRLDVHAEGPAVSDDVIRTAARDLAERLTRRGENVWTGVGPAELAGAYASLLQQAPALLTPEEQETALCRATPEYLRGRFAEVRSRLADPDGEILLRRLAADPLNLSEFVTRKLAALSPAGKEGGAAMSMEEGQLTARDEAGGLHVMLVLSPRTAPSDQRAAEATLAGVEADVAAVQRAHPGVGCWVVGAHRGYVENAQRIKADVGIVSLVGTLAVAGAIFFYFYRGTRAAGWPGVAAGAGPVLLCMVPQGIGIGMALGVAGMIGAELPLILLGFVGLLCGSTTDYGIQVIAECRRLARGVPWEPSIPARAARRLLGPISMSVITSATAFAALGLSTSPGLRAMGLFVALASICIWMVTFFVLPAFITAGVGAASAVIAQPAGPMLRRWRWPALVAFLGVTLWLTWQTLHVQFNNDPRSLDGSSARLRAEEAALYRVWGDLRNRAVVLVRGKDAGEALERAAQVHAYLADQRRDGLIADITSAAGADGILPPQDEVARRLAPWGKAWTEDRRSALAGALADAARAAGMRAEAFTVYAGRVVVPQSAGAADRLRQSPAALLPGFIQQDPGGVTLAIVVQMRGDVSLRRATAWGSELRLRFDDWGSDALSLLSGNLLIFDATERARAEGERFAPLCLLAILVPLWMFFRRLRTAWLAMFCLIVGLVWVLGSAQLLAAMQGTVGGLNLLSLVPVLFTLGVVIDYGIYACTAPPADDGTRGSATFLCALSTLAGSAGLVLAAHPVLRWLGVTLVAGIVGGYLTSVLVVAPLVRRRQQLREKPRREGVARIPLAIARLGLRGGLALLTLLLAAPPFVEWVLARQRPTGAEDSGAEASNLPPVRRLGPRTYAVGDSWLRWREDPTSADSGLWEFLLAGTPAERGHATAKLAGPIDLRIEHEMLDQLDTLLPQAWSRWLVLRGVGANLLDLPAYVSPEVQQEIYSAAKHHRDSLAYLAPTYPRILSYHALHDVSQMLIDNPLIVPQSFACTGVVSLPSYSTPGPDGTPGNLLLGRIFDFEGGDSFGRQKSITYVIPPGGEGIPFAHVAWPGLSGAVTGMNQEKIALFMNAAATRDFRRIGTPTILLAREILQHARTLDDAERLIAGTQTFVSDILVVADGKTGQARVFEKSPARLGTYDVQDSLAVTNHLVSPAFADDRVNRSRREEGTTLQRHGRARQLLDRLKGRATPEGFAGLLRDKRGLEDKPLGWGNRNAIDGLIACHAVVMDVSAGHLWVAAWPHAEGTFVGVDVMAMLDRAAGAGGRGRPEFAPILPAIGRGQDSMMVAGPDGVAPWAHWQASRHAADQAMASLRSGDGLAALGAADEVVRSNPDFYLGHDLRGRALLKQGDAAGAKAAFERALALDPPYLKRRQELEGLIRQCDTRK